jgi:hypothetical protein
MAQGKESSRLDSIRSGGACDMPGEAT